MRFSDYLNSVFTSTQLANQGDNETLWLDAKTHAARHLTSIQRKIFIACHFVTLLFGFTAMKLKLTATPRTAREIATEAYQTALEAKKKELAQTKLEAVPAPTDNAATQDTLGPVG